MKRDMSKENDQSKLKDERDYYKFYMELHEKSYHFWRAVALTLIGVMSFTLVFALMFILLSTRI